MIAAVFDEEDGDENDVERLRELVDLDVNIVLIVLLFSTSH